jgi:hypothetical protein
MQETDLNSDGGCNGSLKGQRYTTCPRLVDCTWLGFFWCLFSFTAIVARSISSSMVERAVRCLTDDEHETDTDEVELTARVTLSDFVPESQSFARQV